MEEKKQTENKAEPSTENIIKIKDLHPTIESYLKNDCYCPYEVYSPDGFFYQIFKPEDDCVRVFEKDDAVACIANNQLILFTKHLDRVVDAVRIDATENNVKLIIDISNGIADKSRRFDKFPDNSTDEDIKKLLSIAHAVIVS